MQIFDFETTTSEQSALSTRFVLLQTQMLISIFENQLLEEHKRFALLQQTEHCDLLANLLLLLLEVVQTLHHQEQNQILAATDKAFYAERKWGNWKEMGCKQFISPNVVLSQDKCVNAPNTKHKNKWVKTHAKLLLKQTSERDSHVAFPNKDISKGETEWHSKAVC